MQHIQTFALAALLCGDAFAGNACPMAIKPVASAQAAGTYAAQAAQVYGLSKTRAECMTYQSGDDKSGGFWVSFYEHHTPQCGGIPEVAPRLFTILVSEKGRMTTDAYGMGSGKYRSLKCPRTTRR